MTIKKQSAVLRQLLKPIKTRSKGIKRDALEKSFAIEKEQDIMSQQNSLNSPEPLNDSKEYWPEPTTLREFTAQVNIVASKVLNGEIGLEKARLYASLGKIVAQTVSTEVTRSRFLKQAPDLTFQKAVSTAVDTQENDDD